MDNQQTLSIGSTVEGGVLGEDTIQGTLNGELQSLEAALEGQIGIPIEGSLGVTLSALESTLTGKAEDAPPVAAFSGILEKPLPIGSTTFTFNALKPTTEYFVGVKYVDAFGGESEVAGVFATTGTFGTLSGIRKIVLRQARGQFDNFLDEIFTDLIGMEVGWSNRVSHAQTRIQVSQTLEFSEIDEEFVVDPGVSRTFILTPLDDIVRYVRVRHEREGFTPSGWSPVVRGQPTRLLENTDGEDGFPTGYGFLSLTGEGFVIVNIGSDDPDTDGVYYTLTTDNFLDPEEAGEPSASAVFVPFEDFPLVDITDTQLLTPEDNAFLWVRFWNAETGFSPSAGSKHRIGLQDADLRPNVNVISHRWRNVQATPPILLEYMQLRVRFQIGLNTRSLRFEYSFTTKGGDSPVAVNEVFNVGEFPLTNPVRVGARMWEPDTGNLGGPAAFGRDGRVGEMTVTPYSEENGAGMVGDVVTYQPTFWHRQTDETSPPGVEIQDGGTVLFGTGVVAGDNLTAVALNSGLVRINASGNGGGGATSLDDLSDVAITSLANRHGIFYDGTTFVNRFIQVDDLPALPASKITTGRFPFARLSTLSAGQVYGRVSGSGDVEASPIVNFSLRASQVGGGTLSQRTFPSSDPYVFTKLRRFAVEQAGVTTTAGVAAVIVSTSDPSGDAPDGTLWCKVAE
jgi:hypothetical protein